MKAEAKSLRWLGEGKKLTIPFFQRNYVWKKENWEELLYNFDNVDSVMPFIGSIIIKNVTKALSVEEKMIIDGQQRLTTLTILAKAIYDSLSEESQEDSGITNDIKNFLFYKTNTSHPFSKSIVRIEHSRIDIKYYNRIIRSGLFNDAPKIDNYSELDSDESRIYACYKYFREVLSTRTEDDLHHLHDALFEEKNKVFVLIELEYGDVNEQCIFDTINRAGKKLSAADIIKNNLFKGCLETCQEASMDIEDVCSLHDEKWASLFYGDSNATKLWEEERIFGNVTKTNHEFLLYCVAMINWGKNYIADNNKKNTIFKNLEKVYIDNTNGYTYIQFEKLITQIHSLGKLYRTYIIDFQKSLKSNETIPHLSFEDHVKRLLLILEIFGVQMFYPYVLHRLSEANEQLNNSELIKDFRILESFVVRRRVSGKGVTDYAEKCNKILHDGGNVRNVLLPELNSPDSDTNDASFRESINKIKNNETAKILLYCIELYRRADLKHDIKELCYNYTLEHIMPVKWTNHWSAVPIVDDDGNELDQNNPDVISERNKAIYSLGNMVLLTSKLNSSLNNREFSIKIDGDGKNSGYKKYGSLLLTRDVVDFYPNIWNEKSIKERTSKLFREILCVWPDYYSESPENTLTSTPASRTTEEICETDPDTSLYTDEHEQLLDPIELLGVLE